MQTVVVKYSLVISSLLLFWGISQPVILSPSLSFISEFIVFTSLLFLLISSFLIVRTSNISFLCLFLVFLSAIPIAQWLLGIVFFRGDAFLVCAYLLGAAMAVFVGNNLSQYRGKALLFFSLTFLYIGIVNAFFAWVQLLDLNFLGVWLREPSSLRVYGNIGQPNLFASIMMLSLLAMIYLFEKTQCHRSLFWLVSTLILSAIVLAQSRTTLVAGLFIIIWYALSYTRVEFRIRWFDVIVLVIIYLGLRWFVGELLVLLFEEGTNLRAINTSASPRLSLWQGMVAAINDGPLWGYGWAQAGVAQVLADSPFKSIQYSQHSHNLLIDLMIWNGPILGLVIIAVFTYIAYKCVVQSVTIERWVATSMVGAVLVHSMLEFPIEYAYFLLPVGFLLGLCFGESCIIYRFRLPKWIPLSIICVFVGLLTIVWRDYKIISHEFKQAKFEQINIKGVVVPEKKMPEVFLLNHWSYLVGFMRTKPESVVTLEEIEWARKVSYRFAYISNLYFYIKVMHLNGNELEVERMMRVVDKIYGEKGIRLVNENL